jgi:hypothetical protein
MKAQVAKDFAAGGRGDEDGAGFVAFAVKDLDGAGFEIDILDIESGEFGAAEAGIEECVKDGSVTGAVEGFIAGLDELLDLGEGDAGQGFGIYFGRFDFADETLDGRIVEFDGIPAEEGFDGAISGMDAAGIASGG